MPQRDTKLRVSLRLPQGPESYLRRPAALELQNWCTAVESKGARFGFALQCASPHRLLEVSMDEGAHQLERLLGDRRGEIAQQP